MTDVDRQESNVAPQGQLFGQELHKLTMTLLYDDVRHMVICQLLASTRRGEMLASAGVHFRGIAECELIPILCAESAYGFLYRGSSDCTTIPAGAARARRKSLVV